MSKYDIQGARTFAYTKIIGVDNIDFGRNVLVGDFAFIYATTFMKIGSYVHIASFSSVVGGAELILEDFVAISQGARILTSTHDFKDWEFGNSTVPQKYRNVTRKPVHIEKICIVGANSVVLPSVKIDECAMVGANSVVTRDLDAWEIYLGNKRISERNKKAVLENYQNFLDEENETF